MKVNYPFPGDLITLTPRDSKGRFLTARSTPISVQNVASGQYKVESFKSPITSEVIACLPGSDEATYVRGRRYTCIMVIIDSSPRWFSAADTVFDLVSPSSCVM